MYIWTVCFELDWSRTKGEWDGEDIKTVAAKTAEVAVEKAKKLTERECKPWEDDGDVISLVGVRLVSIERGDKIDG